MADTVPVRLDDCDVYLASPARYKECVVLVDHRIGEIVVVADEKLDGQCVLELPKLETSWMMSLDDFRAMLDKAERLLGHGGRDARAPS